MARKQAEKGYHRELSHPFMYGQQHFNHMSVYMSALSNRAQQLIKYCHTVRTAASRHTGWGGGLTNIMYNSD